MKSVTAFLVLLLMSSTVLAQESQVKASNEERVMALSLVEKVTSVYSNAAGVRAKVIESLGGDGLNASRMTLVLENGRPESMPVFELGIMMVEVRRVTFLSLNEVVINYSQDNLDPEDDSKFVLTNRSITVKFKIESDGSIASKIDISK